MNAPGVSRPLAPDLSLCPHCGSQSVIENGVCGVCGGPRIPNDLGGEAAALALKEQKKHLGVARLASVSTVLQALFAAAVTVVCLIAAPQTMVARGIFFFLAAMPLVLALRSRSRAGKARAAAHEAGERAWMSAAEEAARGGATANEVAKRLRIAPDRADKLLTTSAGHDRVRVDVHPESAEIVYRSEDDAPPADEAARERRR